MALLHRVPEVAEQLGLHRNSVLNLIKSGQLESIKIGRARRIPDEALNAFVARLRKEQAGDAA